MTVVCSVKDADALRDASTELAGVGDDVAGVLAELAKVGDPIANVPTLTLPDAIRDAMSRGRITRGDVENALASLGVARLSELDPSGECELRDELELPEPQAALSPESVATLVAAGARVHEASVRLADVDAVIDGVVSRVTGRPKAVGSQPDTPPPSAPSTPSAPPAASAPSTPAAPPAASAASAASASPVDDEVDLPRLVADAVTSGRLTAGRLTTLLAGVGATRVSLMDDSQRAAFLEALGPGVLAGSSAAAAATVLTASTMPTPVLAGPLKPLDHPVHPVALQPIARVVDPGSPSLQDLTALVNRLASTGRDVSVEATLMDLAGVTRVSQLPEDKYGEAMDALTALELFA